MWEFQVNSSGITDGWNDSDIQTFRHNKLKSLAREIIQNSIDAKLKNNLPVKVKFELLEINAQSIPDIDGLQEWLEAIISEDAKHESEISRKEMNEALACLKASKINVLLISDTNTRGMPDNLENDSSSDFYRYMKVTGSSGGDQTRAGSHGLGKAAPLTTTPLRTIFVGTSWAEKNGEIKTLYQGRTRLMRRTKDNKVYAGVGFWGGSNFQPIAELPSSRFEWLKRSVRGTTIAVPGFRSSAKKEWTTVVSGYVVSEFFAAIQRGTLEVQIEDKTVRNLKTINITKTSLRTYLNNKVIWGEVQNYINKDVSDLEDAVFYNRCISDNSDATVNETIDLGEEFGKLILHLLVEKDAPRKICFIRKNMKITEDLSSGVSGKTLWKPGRVPPKIKDFVGVVEVLDGNAEQILRSMEPPQHNSLSIEYMPEIDQTKGRKLLNLISEKLREIVEEHAIVEFEEERPVTEISEYFYDDSEYDPDATTVTKEIDPNGKLVIHTKPIKATPKPPPKVDDLPNNDEPPVDLDDEDETIDPRPERPPRPKPNPIIENMLPLEHQRLIKNGDKYTLNIRCNKAVDCFISIQELGIDIRQEIKVISNTLGSLQSDGRIKILSSDFNGKRITFEFELASEPVGGLTVIASEIEKDKKHEISTI